MRSLAERVEVAGVVVEEEVPDELHAASTAVAAAMGPRWLRLGAAAAVSGGPGRAATPSVR